MKTLERNKRTFYYATYQGEQMLTDSEGNFTGERGITYSEPVKVRGYVSPANGGANAEVFGTQQSYDKTIILNGGNWPIDENTVVYIDSDPKNAERYDYKVTGVAESLNHTTIAISKVAT